MDTETVTPTELARDLGISPKRVRAILREHFGTLRPPETRWHISAEQVALVRRLLTK